MSIHYLSDVSAILQFFVIFVAAFMLVFRGGKRLIAVVEKFTRAIERLSSQIESLNRRVDNIESQLKEMFQTNENP